MTCRLCETEHNREVWNQIKYTAMAKKEYDICDHLEENIAKAKTTEEQSCPDESKVPKKDWCKELLKNVAAKCSLPSILTWILWFTILILHA